MHSKGVQAYNFPRNTIHVDQRMFDVDVDVDVHVDVDVTILYIPLCIEIAIDYLLPPSIIFS